MNLPNVFETCEQRGDGLNGTIVVAKFAGDCANDILGAASVEHNIPACSLGNAYLTQGLNNLLLLVLAGVTGGTSTASLDFPLNTNCSTGRIHSIAPVTHDVKGRKGVASATYLVDLKLAPQPIIHVSACTGINAHPGNGGALEGSVIAFSPSGELGCCPLGKAAFEFGHKSCESHNAPAKESLTELFVGES